MMLKLQSSILSPRTEALRKLKQKMKKCRVCVRQIVRSNFFYWSVIVCVFLNTLVIALEHHGQPQFLTDFQGLWIQKGILLYMDQESLKNTTSLVACNTSCKV